MKSTPDPRTGMKAILDSRGKGTEKLSYVTG